MKKTYIEPQMECIAIKAAKFLCGSLKGDGLQMTIGGTAETDAEGREFDFTEE